MSIQSSSRISIHTRQATLDDVGQMVLLNRAAYPDLIEDNVVFSEDQIRAHIERFPRGQLVVEHEGALAGAMATLILPTNIDALGPHTWMGVTDGGFFSRHDPKGRTLYLADIYVDPAQWGRGVSQALYAALWDLCREVGLRHVVAGGRLFGYTDVAERMTPKEYVDRVIRGEQSDRVLGSQLRAGFVVRGLLRNYLHDWRSRNWATLLEWVNPDVVRDSGRDERPSTPPSVPARPALSRTGD
jgi:GNAT superfamily N-acetyltransferase